MNDCLPASPPSPNTISLHHHQVSRMEVSSPLLVCCVCTALPASFQASSNFLSTRSRPVPSLLFVALVSSSTKQCNVVLIDLVVHKFWQMKGLADTHSYVYDLALRRCLCKGENNGQCLESSPGLWRNLRHLPHIQPRAVTVCL